MFFLISLLFCSQLMGSTNSLETTRNSIILKLNKEHPATIGEFKKFCRKYDILVSTFFDKKNNDSLKTHVCCMESEFQVFQKVCDDPRYQSVRGVLVDYYARISELISVLKDYIGSHNALSLCFKVCKFKGLLPESVKERGDISLFHAVYHRLRCE